MRSTPRSCLHLEIQGAVQGVGFRPFVYRLAHELDLNGWVLNGSQGVILEVEGEEATLARFLERLERENPPRSIIQSLEATWSEAAGVSGFEIRHSDRAGQKVAVVLPDVATCSECLAEALEPQDRRFRYPFTNCTNCGPRFTIVEALPYDRPSTTMRGFAMCTECQGEYDDPLNRRFHAQPNACSLCGPHIEQLDSGGNPVAAGWEALQMAADAIRDGEIVAVKGLGGFHLVVDGRDDAAVQRLRARKARYEKPLAIMAPDLDSVRSLCDLSAESAGILASPEAPILLLPRRAESEGVAPQVAPNNPYLGVMLPYTPLHHLLMRELGFPVVATSGNLSDEPICIDNREAVERLGDIADCFLVHDRPIARHADDSVVTQVAGEAQPVRRARGLAPLPIILDRECEAVLATGAHLKNTVALSIGRRVFVSQHVGDMETAEAHEVFERVIRDFVEIYEAEPHAIAHDLHPDYPSTGWARKAVQGGPFEGLPLVPVQHHHAHLASCLADNDHAGPALGVTWDGTGYGPDDTVWGGEFLLGDAAGYRRVGSLRPFRLPGGEAAIQEPRRVAIAMLRDLPGGQVWERSQLAPVQSFREPERRLLDRMLDTGFRAPLTTSAGRLFDAVAALLDLRQQASFEGQAAMSLEFVSDLDEPDAYPIGMYDDDGMLRLDWRPTLDALIEDSQRGSQPGIVSARFHNALVEGLVCVAEAVGTSTVALSGGCFQNRLLTERTIRRLGGAGFRVLVHRRVPPNDGGISLGQVAVATARLARDGRAG